MANGDYSLLYVCKNTTIQLGIKRSVINTSKSTIIYLSEFDYTLIGSDVIKAIQMGLKAKGYYNGVIDGLCG